MENALKSFAFRQISAERLALRAAQTLVKITSLTSRYWSRGCTTEFFV